MAKKDYDMDFDFDEELDFGSDDFLKSDDNMDIDLDSLDLDALMGELPAEGGDLDLEGLDLDGLDLSDLDLDGLDFGEEEAPAAPEAQEPAYEEPAQEDWEEDFLDEDVSEDFLPEEEFDEPEEADIFTGRGRQAPQEEYVNTDFDEDDFEAAVYGKPQEPAVPQPQEEPEEEFDEPEEVEGYEPPQEEPQQPREDKPIRQRRERPQKKEKPVKEKPVKTGPTFFDKFLAYYLSPLQEKPQEPGKPRRRKPSRARIFKEVYLPPIIAGVTLVLVLVFAIGSITNAIDQKKLDDAAAEKEQQSQAQQEQQQVAEAQRVINEAKALALGYNYTEAMAKLDSYTGDMTQEMIALRAEYQNTDSQLVEYKDYTSIGNLSFQMLIADPARAFADAELGGKYNQNFVTVDEFEKILEQLYAGGYVLVNFESFTEMNTGLDGNATFFPNPIRLPQGKKPIMITQTMVNYLGYMVDSNDDGEPDAGGAGFAYRMIVNDQGDIKAQMVDANGQTQTGNYDLVPILEDFIKQHPDFSYKGARATLAVTGEEGVFGYRTVKSYISSKGQAYYDEEVLGAQTLVNALRQKGYRIACFTYGNKAYGQLSATQIQADLQEWTNEITPVIGEVDTLIFARTSDIGDYSGPKFDVLYKTGFRYFVKHGSDTYAEINNTYVRQTRLMVTGENMAWYSDQFSEFFDCAPLMNNLRGNVPKAG